MENLGKSQRTWRRKVSSWGLKIALILLAAFWLALIASSWAEAAEPKEDDEYSFKWLDPEKKIYVLQNRKYLKANHLMLSLLGGPGLSNPYRTSWTAMPRLAFYFSESWGLEAFYGYTTNSENTIYKALIDTNVGTYPVIREIRSEMGGLLHWVPWYAKINVFNKVLYFDWYFSGGAGTLHTALNQPPSAAFRNEDLFSLFAGTGHQYHLSQLITIRLDLMGSYYSAFGNGKDGEKVWFSNYDFTLGLGFRI